MKVEGVHFETIQEKQQDDLVDPKGTVNMQRFPVATGASRVKFETCQRGQKPRWKAVSLRPSNLFK